MINSINLITWSGSTEGILLIGWIVSSKKIRRIFNLQSLWMWLYLEMGLSRCYQIKMKSLGWALIQHD